MNKTPGGKPLPSQAEASTFPLYRLLWYCKDMPFP